MDGPDSIEAQVCRGDFWEMMKEAVEQAGGNPEMVTDGINNQTFETLVALGIPKVSRQPYADMTLRQVVNILAQNGIRMVHIPGKGCDAVRFEEKSANL